MALTVREFVKKSLREFYKRLKQHLSDLYATKQEIEDNSLVTSAALNDLNDRLVDVEEGDWVTTEEYSEIESVVRDTYTKQEIDVMLDNVDVDLTEYYTKSQADSKFATTSQIPTQTSQLTNNSGFITSESDPVFSASPAANITSSDITNWNNKTSNTGTVTQVKVGSTAYNPSNGVVSLPAYPTTLPASDVSSWAKASTKPTYTASEVGAATQSDINTAIQNLIGTAPAALDTLGEIADALNDDANLAATLTNQIAAKYTKPSTGIPKSDLASTVQASLDRADTALQSYTETDPVFSASAAAGITTNDIDAWDAKQDAISDLATIRSNAAAGAAKISNVQADWNASSGLAQILNKPTIPKIESLTTAEIDTIWNNAS